MRCGSFLLFCVAILDIKLRTCSNTWWNAASLIGFEYAKSIKKIENVFKLEDLYLNNASRICLVLNEIGN